MWPAPQNTAHRTSALQKKALCHRHLKPYIGNKKLLGAPGLTTGSKDATRSGTAPNGRLLVIDQSHQPLPFQKRRRFHRRLKRVVVRAPLSVHVSSGPAPWCLSLEFSCGPPSRSDPGPPVRSRRRKRRSDVGHRVQDLYEDRRRKKDDDAENLRMSAS